MFHWFKTIFQIGKIRQADIPDLITTIELPENVTWKKVRKVAILILGSSVLLVGLVMIVLPGPAFIVIPTGLAILGTEFLWARRIMKRFKSLVQNTVYTHDIPEHTSDQASSLSHPESPLPFLNDKTSSR